MIDGGAIGATAISEISQKMRKIKTKRTRRAKELAPLKIAVLHHHITKFPTTEIKEFESLIDGGFFLSNLVENKFNVILHGHKHRAMITSQEFSYEAIPWRIYLASGRSLSCKTRDVNGFSFYDVDQHQDGWSVGVSQFTFSGHKFVKDQKEIVLRIPSYGFLSDGATFYHIIAPERKKEVLDLFLREAAVIKHLGISAQALLGSPSPRSTVLGRLLEKNSSLRVEMLLLDPDSEFVEASAKFISYSARDLQASINSTLSIMKFLREKYRHRLEVRLYNSLPVWSLYVSNRHIIVQAYNNAERRKVDQTDLLFVGDISTGFARGLSQSYEGIWTNASKPF